MKTLNAKSDAGTPADVQESEGARPGTGDNEDKEHGVDPGETAFTKAVRKSIDAVREQLASDPEASIDPDDPLPGVPKSVDVNRSIADDPMLKAATSSESGPKFNIDSGISEMQVTAAAAILPRHRQAFAESLITGERYTEEFDLLGGRMHIVVRSRSSDETEAITAYSRRMVVMNKVRTDYDYSALLRKILAVAQVEEINGVKQPRMENPLFFEETREELIPPAWEPRIKEWGDKPEAVLAAVVRCILEFEARYWEMIRKVNDADFWLPEGPTGE